MTVRAYLITRPAFDVDAFLTFLADGQMTWQRSPGAREAEEIVESAGRVCYLSFGAHQSPRTNAEYITHLVEMGHESVLEHVNWGFVLTGVSRAFTHQLVRHRVGFAFSQLSQQYHDERDASFVEPADLATFPAARAAWQKAVATARNTYREILNSLDALEASATPKERKEIRRAIRSAARSVLPNATETKIFVTGNARAFRHFFRVRGALVGDEEMRNGCAALLRPLKLEAPALFADYEIIALADRSPMVVHQSSTRRRSA
jgi:thymidylate synthase (FAD)